MVFNKTIVKIQVASVNLCLCYTHRIQTIRCVNGTGNIEVHSWYRCQCQDSRDCMGKKCTCCVRKHRLPDGDMGEYHL